jgi:hypothetical protein
MKSSLCFLQPKNRMVLPTVSPLRAISARSWMKPLKGATPVPGPTMMMGFEGSEGSLKFEWRTWTGT